MTVGQQNQRRAFLGAVAASLWAMFMAKVRAHAAVPQTRHRRVVTGVNAAGKSVVTSDGPVPAEGGWSEGGADGADLWCLDHVPVDLSDSHDPISGYKGMEWPPEGGAIARTGTWPSGFQFPMHRSATIDFLFIISGRIELLLDDGSVKLGPGDCCVQRGTNHGWRVVGDQPCTWGGVLLSAKT
jgi:mannose-6-phosphate isomerase-like protein (cupin superfamily)